MKHKAAALAAGLFLLASQTTGQTWLTGSFEDARDAAAKSGKRLLIQFHSFGCRNCDLLNRQFFEARAFRDFLEVHFILLRAERGVGEGDELFERFHIRVTPAVLLLENDGTVFDWHVGYGSSPEEYLGKLERSLQGIDTYRELAIRHARHPEDVAVVFALARKHNELPGSGRAADYFLRVLELDPDGQSGATRYLDRETSFTEASAFALGLVGLSRPPQNPEEMKAFIRNYPSSPLLRKAYENLGFYYRINGAEDDAVDFFEEFVSGYPDDAQALNAYVTRILRDKSNLDRGIELARKIQTLTAADPVPAFNQNMSRLHLLKGEGDRAHRIYGRAFMEQRISDLAYDLAAFANFWCDRNDNLDAALAMSQTALRLEPDNVHFIHITAKLHMKMGDDAKALEIFGADFVESRFHQPLLLHRYAQFWLKQGKNLDSALKAAERARVMLPASPQIWEILTDLYLSLGRITEALKAAEMAISAIGDADLEITIRYKKRVADILEIINRKRS